MKVRIFRDATGKVLASAETSKDEKEISVAPQLEKGHTAEEVSAADHYTQDLKAFYKKNEKAATH